ERERGQAGARQRRDLDRDDGVRVRHLGYGADRRRGRGRVRRLRPGAHRLGDRDDPEPDGDLPRRRPGADGPRPGHPIPPPLTPPRRGGDGADGADGRVGRAGPPDRGIGQVPAPGQARRRVRPRPRRLRRRRPAGEDGLRQPGGDAAGPDRDRRRGGTGGRDRGDGRDRCPVGRSLRPDQLARHPRPVRPPGFSARPGSGAGGLCQAQQRRRDDGLRRRERAGAAGPRVPDARLLGRRLDFWRGAEGGDRWRARGRSEIGKGVGPV
ncbi:MAG: 2,4-dihydroxyhept-2-ene-1,7-dioic acid aldolase, partial [uncultured Thermomicrobiales bacterium]